MGRHSRENQSWVGRWWWTIDRYSFVAVIMLMLIGAMLVTASSPAVAERLGREPFFFVKSQIIFLILAAATVVFISMQSPRNIRRLAFLGLAGSFFLMLLLPFFGYETKGASRWISIFGISIQPSEFMKPCFAITTAWIFALRQKYVRFPAYWISIAIYLIAISLLAIQPDFGMMVMTTAIWSGQIFLAGLPMLLVIGLIILAVGGGFGAYFVFDHVKSRIDRFLDPKSGDNYQVERSLEAFENGKFFGKGPGEGQVKLALPDSHTDFIYAVAGEEFGIIFCLFIAGLFFLITLWGVKRIWREGDSFIMIAVAGLLIQFSVQALVNMGVAVQILPAKGMTLPFLSYGGSSAIAVALTMGMVLALTRKRFGKEGF